jgi:hypothetical protein
MYTIRIRFSRALLLILFLVGCVEPYYPPDLATKVDVLVVDGFINASENTARVSLTKALNLESDVQRLGVTSADVRIESEDGQQFSLIEQLGDVTGIYFAENLSLDLSKKYKLKVFIGFNKEYESELIPILETPEIEEVNWTPHEDGVKILVSSVEATQDKSKYYRWRYQETWRYSAPYGSIYELIDGEVFFRDNFEELFLCYESDPTSDIQLGSAASLSINTIKNKEIHMIDRSSIKISSIYSINVQQLSLTDAGYSYWVNLDKMTESLGGLFDPMPGQVIGNIKNIANPGETVVGFFSGSTVTEKRIFINRRDLPSGYLTYKQSLCEVDTVLIADLKSVPQNNLLIGSVNEPNGTSVIGYTMSDKQCVDCKLYGHGTPTKPDFWP